jgi:sialic acid synthase SpsE
MNLESNISKTLIIAEAGVNHNGDLDMLLKKVL